jgi:hypothetical protein
LLALPVVPAAVDKITLFAPGVSTINPATPVNPLPSPSNDPLNEPEPIIAKSAIEAVVALSACEAVVAKLDIEAVPAVCEAVVAKSAIEAVPVKSPITFPKTEPVNVPKNEPVEDPEKNE